jgi:putative spermidine/putrescine transport system permease protein
MMTTAANRVGRWSRGPLVVVFLLLLCLFMIGPLVVVVLESLTNAKYVGFPPTGYSLHWYHVVFENSRFTHALFLSIYIALAVAVVAGICGTCTAFAITRYWFRGKGLVSSLTVAPLTVPAIALGIALLSIEALVGIVGNVYVIFLAHLLIGIAFVVNVTRVGVGSIDENSVVAAGTLGAKPWTVFWQVVFPQFRSTLVVGCLFAFAISFDEIGIALFIVGPNTTTLPVAMFIYMEQNYDPMVMAVGTLLLVIAAVPVLIMQRFVGLARVLGLED